MHKDKNNKNKKRERSRSRDKIPKENINDYFKSDIKKEEDIIKSNQKNYSLSTFINSKKRPDIYLGGRDFISGKNYVNIRHQKDTEEEKTKKQIESDEMENDNDNDNDANNTSPHHESEGELGNKYNDMKNINIRFFNYEQNITIKCFNCGEVGHLAKNCPNETIIYCLRCNLTGHDERDCQLTKCFKCNQLGHKNMNCPFGRGKLILCNRCNGIGHKEKDCLSNPFKINNNTLKYNGYYCEFCGSREHLICSFPKESKVELREVNENDEGSEEGEVKEEKRIFEKFENKDIKKYFFCPICAGKHNMINCKKLKEFGYNDFDEKRRNFVKSLFGDKEKRNNNDFHSGKTNNHSNFNAKGYK